MINIAGASDGRIAQTIIEKYHENKGQYLIVVPTQSRASRLETDLNFFADLNGLNNANHDEDNVGTASKLKVCILPPDEESIAAYEAKSNEDLLKRMKVLKLATSGEPCIIIAPVTGAIKKLPPSEIFRENLIRLELGQDIVLEEIREKLSLLGYERVPMIEARGEYSVRGGIIDVFTPEGEKPYRIELFDTEIDSIRNFDLDTQRSLETLHDITIYQCAQLSRDEELFAKAKNRIKRAYDRSIKKMPELSEALAHRKEQLIEYTDSMINLQYMEKFLNYFYEELDCIWDYMDSPTLMIDNPSRCIEVVEETSKEHEYDMEEMLENGRAIAEDFESLASIKDYFSMYEIEKSGDIKTYLFTPFVTTIKGPHGASDSPKLDELIQIENRQIHQYNGKLDILKTDIEGYIARGFEVNIVCSTDERNKNMIEFVERENFNHRILPGRYEAGKVNVIQGQLSAGTEFTDKRQCFIWEGDIFGESKRNRKRRRSKTSGEGNSKRIRSFADLNKGDYVVHEAHGIGKFTGVEQLIVQGIKRDFLRVEYAGSDMLYIPVDQLDQLQKYIGGDGITPKINKLSGNEWKSTKAKAVAAVSDMAGELLRVANARRNTPGYAFGEDTSWQKSFEESFPYTETDDQLRCIEEIKEDMEKPYPMDRLLCGDVGFGKTEVAARALFKCVIEGKQAAVLVPTTLLANQHYYTLKTRFEKFPVRVEMLSRFRSKAEQTKIIKGLEDGQIDLVIGTHRLLSKDIKFNDLGLLVIDEEQRFGVKHKEKIKLLRENIDVLTLSATPIPRTLHMSLSGMKDMSTIEEPPEDRYPVQTYVMEEDEFLIREVIEKEIARGGQVYILYNRVKGINALASNISNLLPNISVAVGHGQMNERELENVILDFANGEYDVLVSTTIIESGMDIPNVNTMIVLDADRFGLAQLYQLRGRVGRGNRMAYAYLMYRKDKVLSEIAEKRLKAIRDFTEFGSGFRIAMRDLELRGAGNLLGKEQSGHMLEIGYELYCKLLDDALKEESARIERGESEEEFNLNEKLLESTASGRDTVAINLPISALIPSRYIDDETLKLQMYKKIAFIESEEDAADLLDEFIDRFADPPVEVQYLLKLAVIRAKAKALGVTEISQQANELKFMLDPEVQFKSQTVPNLVAAYGYKIKFNGGKQPFIALTAGVNTKTATKPQSPNYSRAILKELELFFDAANDDYEKSYEN